MKIIFAAFLIAAASAAVALDITHISDPDDDTKCDLTLTLTGTTGEITTATNGTYKGLASFVHGSAYATFDDSVKSLNLLLTVTVAADDTTPTFATDAVAIGVQSVNTNATAGTADATATTGAGAATFTSASDLSYVIAVAGFDPATALTALGFTDLVAAGGDTVTTASATGRYLKGASAGNTADLTTSVNDDSPAMTVAFTAGAAASERRNLATNTGCTALGKYLASDYSYATEATVAGFVAAGAISAFF